MEAGKKNGKKRKNKQVPNILCFQNLNNRYLGFQKIIYRKIRYNSMKIIN